jgi:hypothetical protein
MFNQINKYVYQINNDEILWKAQAFTNTTQKLKGQSHEKVCEIIPLNDRLGPN